MSSKKSSVKVSILGEEYTIRSEAAPEHTRAVAEYYDKAVRQVMNAGVVLETQRAAILAALQITGELLEARRDGEDLAERMQKLAEDVRPLLPPAKRVT
jgi:cell division protein ZapA